MFERKENTPDMQQAAWDITSMTPVPDHEIKRKPSSTSGNTEKMNTAPDPLRRALLKGAVIGAGTILGGKTLLDTAKFWMEVDESQTKETLVPREGTVCIGTIS